MDFPLMNLKVLNPTSSVSGANPTNVRTLPPSLHASNADFCCFEFAFEWTKSDIR